MIKLLKPLVSWWRIFKKTKSAGLAYRLLPEIYTPALNSAVSIQNGKVTFTGYTKSFSKKQLDLFAGHGELLLKFAKSAEVFFSEPGQDEKVCVKINGVEIFLSVKNYENLKVIEEIFLDQLYDFNSNDQFVVCDVGMNVAAATLYFASFSNVEKVYGYEPFPQTFSLAATNIQMNPALSQKIEAKNFGLGNKDERLVVPLPVEGSLGGSTDASFIEQTYNKKDHATIQVEIKNMIPELKNILDKHTGAKIMLKLDCEGAEYDIIEEMERHQLIDAIAVYMIEFHFRGRKSLKDIFSRHQFLVMSPANESISPYGMLYAVNLKK